MAFQEHEDGEDASGNSIKIFGMAAEKGRWLLVFAGMTINLCLGSIFSWSIFVHPVEDFFTLNGFHITANEALMPPSSN
jgi:MFS transporter, OFA family, oxalate/formate antiporter